MTFTKEGLVATLRSIIGRIENNDSREGNIEYRSIGDNKYEVSAYSHIGLNAYFIIDRKYPMLLEKDEKTAKHRTTSPTPPLPHEHIYNDDSGVCIECGAIRGHSKG